MSENIVAEIRGIIAAAKPANSNIRKCACNVRAVRADALLHHLAALKPRRRTYERRIEASIQG